MKAMPKRFLLLIIYLLTACGRESTPPKATLQATGVDPFLPHPPCYYGTFLESVAESLPADFCGDPQPHQVVSKEADVTEFVWSDGQWTVFICWSYFVWRHGTAQHQDLCGINEDGSLQKVLASNLVSPVLVSPDEEWLIFGMRGEYWCSSPIYRMHLDGSNQQALDPEVSKAWHICNYHSLIWDEGWIAFSGWDGAITVTGRVRWQ
jgi:hypothetical protein